MLGRKKLLQTIAEKDKLIAEADAKLREQEIQLRQYKNLRSHFNQLVDDVLGKDYYNMGMDVYACDAMTCDDLRDRIRKKRYWRFWAR